MSTSILGLLQNYDGEAWVELFELDLSRVGGESLYFHNGTNQFSQSVVWQGIIYNPFPIQAEGFEMSGDGTPPRPTLSVANVTGAVSAMINEYGDLVGCRLIRRRTMVMFLDAENFINGNDNADPESYVPDQIYFINQKTSETKLQVDFELASALDLDGISLPRRQILCDACLWRYRSGEGCTYSGPPVADKFDNPTTDPEQDNCGKRVTSCQLRFGDTGVLPFGGFPGANKYPF